MATTVEDLTSRIQILENEKASVNLKFNDAATRILGLEAGIRELRKNVNEDKDRKGTREIVESKAIQSLGNMKEAKEYRSWNLKMRNAFDQARPAYGRKCYCGWRQSRKRG